MRVIELELTGQRHAGSWGLPQYRYVVESRGVRWCGVAYGDGREAAAAHAIRQVEGAER